MVDWWIDDGEREKRGRLIGRGRKRRRGREEKKSTINYDNVTVTQGISPSHHLPIFNSLPPPLQPDLRRKEGGYEDMSKCGCMGRERGEGRGWGMGDGFPGRSLRSSG